jgi:hypothetical protein
MSRPTTLYEVSASDRIRWQSRGLKLLNEMWQQGAKAGLTPLMWQLGMSGVGGTATDLDPDERRATIEGWAKLLGLTLTERDMHGQYVRLLAMAKDYGTAKGDIAIHADIERAKGGDTGL